MSDQPSHVAITDSFVALHHLEQDHGFSRHTLDVMEVGPMQLHNMMHWPHLKPKHTHAQPDLEARNAKVHD